MHNLKFKISDALFQGFEVTLDLDYFDSLEKICQQVKQTLMCHLETYHFEILISKLKQKDFHIHDNQIATILIMNEKDTVWVCCH